MTIVCSSSSFSNSIFKVMNQSWAVGMDLIFYVALKKEVARCPANFFDEIPNHFDAFQGPNQQK